MPAGSANARVTHGWKNPARVKHISGGGNRAPDFEPVGERTLCGVREYFHVCRIDLSLERKNRIGKRNTRFLQTQRRSAIGLPGQTSIASSLRRSRDNFRFNRERAHRLPAMGV